MQSMKTTCVSKKPKNWLQVRETNTIRNIGEYAKIPFFSVTLILLYIATAIATIYLFSCIGLFFGTLKNRAELMLPWLVLDLIGFLLTIALLIMSSGYIVVDIVGPFIYCKISNFYPAFQELNFRFTGSFCCSILLFDIVIWFVVHAFYLTLCKMKKLNESAMIPIPPCPPPNSTIPKYYYSSEKIQLNGGDYKHLLTENVDQHNYII